MMKMTCLFDRSPLLILGTRVCITRHWNGSVSKVRIATLKKSHNLLVIDLLDVGVVTISSAIKLEAASRMDMSSVLEKECFKNRKKIFFSSHLMNKEECIME